MPFTVGATHWEVVRIVELPGNPNSRREIRRPKPPVHAVNVDNRDEIPDNGTLSGTAECGAPVWLFRANWPEAAPKGLSCPECDAVLGRHQAVP